MMRGVQGLAGGLLALLLAGLAIEAARGGEEPPKGFEPTTAYRARRVEGWEILVNARLLESRPELADKTLELLRFQLYQVVRRLRPEVVAELRKVRIWVEENEPHHPCMVYHPDQGWLREHGMNPDKARCVEISNAGNFLKWTLDQPWMVFHELAHAYHHQFLPSGFANPAIKRVYDRAKTAGLYDSVLRRGGVKERAYALSNPQEFFAEASEAFLGTNDFFPFVRPELQTHDMATYEVLRTVWESESGGRARAPAATKADVSYGPDPRQTLDVYLPDKGPGPFPTLIWFGRLWEPARTIPPTGPFLRAGCATVGVATRVMNDAIGAKIQPPISVCLLDARRAVQFVRLHAREWNLDPDRIALGGSSQGALPALFVACDGERANPQSADPVERVSTRVKCVGAHRAQPSIDPRRMREWVPGVEWGAPALGCGFAESLNRRDELAPVIAKWSPDALVSKDAPPIYFENNWGLARPDGVGEADYRVHSPAWSLGFQKIAHERGAICFVKDPDHPTETYADIWDFFVRELKSNTK